MELEIVSIVFNDSIKPFYFSPNGIECKRNQKVVVETMRGLELGTVSQEKKIIKPEELIGELKNIVRIATDADLKSFESNVKEAKGIFPAVKKFIKNVMPQIKVSMVSYTLDKSKMIITYVSDERIDYRELVRDLANEFHTRIEMRQIGSRDEVALIGGMGTCGQVCCCKRFLTDFDKVSIKMAKQQGIALNPTKINGMCGRLLCCLKYEDDFYRQMLETMPKVNSFVKTPDGEGKVLYNDILHEKVVVQFIDKDNNNSRQEYELSDIKFSKQSKEITSDDK